MTIKIDKPIVGYSVVKPEEPVATTSVPVKEEPKKKLKRPTVLNGSTYKLKNNAQNYNLYMTVNYNEDQPFEIFLDSSHTDSSQWVKALSRLMSAMLRSPDPELNIQFISKELMKVHSDQGYHTGGKGGFVAGIVQHIGKTLNQIYKDAQKAPQELVQQVVEAVAEEPKEEVSSPATGNKNTCPECGADMTKLDGCDTCLDCGYSKCS